MWVTFKKVPRLILTVPSLLKQCWYFEDDLSLMEKLMEDLDETKRNGWDAILLRSDHFYEERRTSFTNK